ncbi:hypothetical protein RMSM_04507 [Rhodopirellula maiorica SM1]|uniref:Uncharacterized protein n=1 Tax=Rhodopirellula maiorica SM1 TaxID=1265738 RepID=M5RX83_9BACT|nr:hypothetical protein RMSM_04507 [Rhodopirellula maiorica SM1]
MALGAGPPGNFRTFYPLRPDGLRRTATKADGMALDAHHMLTRPFV